jgi:hypothetical protein
LNKPFLIPFRARHISFVNLRPLDQKVLLSVPNIDSTRELEAYEKSGRCWTAIIDNPPQGIPKILGMGGVVQTWQGVAVAWLLTACEIEQHKIFFHKTIIAMLGKAIKELSLHRIDVTVLAEHTTSQKWLERLGFKREGLMQGFDSQGNDYYRYALIKPLVQTVQAV